MKDEFFEQNNCDRCHKSLKVGSSSMRIMSWFTDETICMDCSDKEREIKRKLREQGKKDMEGCGYIPEV